jgi:nucleoside-diphosphate-sugar epimerase
VIPLKRRRIALVGGAGFIGHHLALTLARRGAVVSIIDGMQVNNLLAFASADHDLRNQSLNLSIINERLELLKAAGVPLYIQDARDERALANRLDDLRPQVLIHLAGVSHAQQSNMDPRSAFEHTLRTLQYSLESVRAYLEHFVYFSSSMIYGHFRTEAVTEDAPCQPLGIYGALKYAGEKIVIAHHGVFGLPYTIVRPSALYGPRCVSRRVVQVFIENALAGRDLTVYGDGTDRLDFTYIDDLVDGIVRVIRHEAARNETFNLAYGRSRSISELIELLESHVPGLDVVHKSRGKLMPQRGTLCVDKARSLVGYEPTHPLEGGMEKYLNWYRALGELVQAPAALGPPVITAMQSCQAS